MDPIHPLNGNENASLPVSDLNPIKNLSLKDRIQKRNVGADSGSMSSLKLNPEWKLPHCYSPMSPCTCGGPMRHFAEPRKYWAIPAQKLYSADEDPTYKEYSPLEAPSPRKYTKYVTTYVKKGDAISN